MMAKLCLVICLITQVLFNEKCVMFVISLFDLMWRLGVTGNVQTCKRFNGGEFSLHYQVVVSWVHGLMWHVRVESE